MHISQNALAVKLNFFSTLTNEEQSYLAMVQSEPVTVKAGKELLHERQYSHKVFIVLAGWSNSYKDLPDGSRQIINFPVPGDCVGLRTLLMHTSDHGYSALTDLKFTTIDAPRLMQMFDDFPRIRACFLWSGARDEAMALDHLVGLGRRSAIERTAHFFLELSERLQLVGLATETQYRCPLNQYVLADALGLTSIHINRVLRELRERSLLSVRSGMVMIQDPHELRKLANYQSVTHQRTRAEANAN